MTTFGLLIFDGAEELDFVGPWEVFGGSASTRASENAGVDTLVTIAERTEPVRCAKGLRVVPDHTFDDHPPLDVLLVPGGVGARHLAERKLDNTAVVEWIRKVAARVDWVTSVCTGSPPARSRPRTRPPRRHPLELRGQARGPRRCHRGPRRPLCR